MSRRRRFLATGVPGGPSGLTLVELLVALAVGLFLVGGIVQILLSSSQAYRATTAVSRVQENGRYALSSLARAVRAAGFMGCESMGQGVSVSYQADAFDGSEDHNMVGQPAELFGYLNGADNAKSNGTWDGFFGTRAAVRRRDGTDVMQVFYATGRGTTLDSDMGSVGADMAVDGNTDGLDADDLAIITDCSNATLFEVTSTSEDDDSLEHSDLDRPYLKDSRVFPFLASAYFIGTKGAANEPCDGACGLYRWSIIRNTTQEMVGGVEDFMVFFGEDTSGDGSVDEYKNAAGVTDWGNVYSIRMGLLIASDEAVVTSKPQGYDFTDPASSFDEDDMTYPDDRRYRAPFWITITLRNKLP